MKVNWGALSITTGLILVAASILAVGLMARARISELTAGLTTLKKQMPIVKADIERKVIAEGYAFSKANSEKRAITLEDLKEGHALANQFMGE